jgi:phenylalanine-4-hydroxylase
MTTFQDNTILERLPKHLLDFVIDQPFNMYTSRDHAVWRYVMRQNVRFLGKVAFGNYKESLESTGITIDRIPEMYGMNRILKDIGWAAVAVDGFIPPQAFMEFQAYKVLVIAADIRNVNHIEYTPAPDILHEAAGHAPIIAHKEYAQYLELFGKIGAKAFSSKQDYALYEAIRHLSIIKEDPSTPSEDVKQAEKDIEQLSADMGKPSEMALLRNLHWWTVEYGLIGTPDDFKLYGAGLLSSIGESQECMKDEVMKLPYSIEAQNYSFDITNMQPQLFVARDFAHMSAVLNEFADNMAFRKGGAVGLQTALESDDVATIEFESGLQVSGKMESFTTKNDTVEFVKFNSATQISIENVEIEGQGIGHHVHGYSSPVGFPKVEGVVADSYFNWHGQIGEILELSFKSGISVVGELVATAVHDGKTVLLSFANCTASKDDQVLFDPSWGIYDMILADKVVSTYYGPADAEAFKWEFESPKEKTHKLHYSENDKITFGIYETLRELRENGAYNQQVLADIKVQMDNHCPDEWLLKVELLELAENQSVKTMVEQVKNELEEQSSRKPELKKLISDALQVSDSLSEAL